VREVEGWSIEPGTDARTSGTFGATVCVLDSLVGYRNVGEWSTDELSRQAGYAFNLTRVRAVAQEHADRLNGAS
jgi:hypothetical protein